MFAFANRINQILSLVKLSDTMQFVPATVFLRRDFRQEKLHNFKKSEKIWIFLGIVPRMSGSGRIDTDGIE